MFLRIAFMRNWIWTKVFVSLQAKEFFWVHWLSSIGLMENVVFGFTRFSFWMVIINCLVCLYCTLPKIRQVKTVSSLQERISRIKYWVFMNAWLNVCRLRSPFLDGKKDNKFVESSLVWCTSHQTDKNQVPVSNNFKTVWGGNQSKQ